MATAALFSLDYATSSDIRLHVLYIFPLAAIALHCGRLTYSIGGLGLALIAQTITLASYHLSAVAFLMDMSVSLAASILTVFLARDARAHYLRLHADSLTDPLTAVANRRMLEAALQMEIARQKRQGGLFSLAVLDLNNFKKLNDTQGHHAGDLALQLVARVLGQHTRESDTVARLGGDEFVILMPNTPHAACAELCAKLSALIIKAMAADGFSTSACIGSRTFDEPPADCTTALRAADHVLYAAKRSTAKVICSAQ